MVEIRIALRGHWSFFSDRNDGIHDCMIVDLLWLSRHGPLFTQIYGGCIVKSYAVFSCLAISLAAGTERQADPVTAQPDISISLHG
jgi:hypothetical protein